MTDCEHCQRPKRISARGLCSACYKHWRRTGHLEGYDPTADNRAAHSADYVAAEWAWLSSFGVTKDQAAAQLGMSPRAFEKALDRHSRKQRASA